MIGAGADLYGGPEKITWNEPIAQPAFIKSWTVSSDKRSIVIEITDHLPLHSVIVGVTTTWGQTLIDAFTLTCTPRWRNITGPDYFYPDAEDEGQTWDADNNRWDTTTAGEDLKYSIILSVRPHFAGVFWDGPPAPSEWWIRSRPTSMRIEFTGAIKQVRLAYGQQGSEQIYNTGLFNYTNLEEVALPGAGHSWTINNYDITKLIIEEEDEETLGFYVTSVEMFY